MSLPFESHGLHATVSRNWQLELEQDNADLKEEINQLQQALAGLVEECRYSITSGLPFMTTWTQYRRASGMLLVKSGELRDPQIG
jgi:hypothetical protein